MITNPPGNYSVSRYVVGKSKQTLYVADHTHSNVNRHILIETKKIIGLMVILAEHVEEIDIQNEYFCDA